MSDAQYYKLVVFVPVTHVEAVKHAIFAAGAGRQGNYGACCWQTLGIGQFMPLAGSQPFIGQQDTLQQVAEYRIETLCPASQVHAVAQALQAAHPYEEAAFEFLPVYTPHLQ